MKRPQLVSSGSIDRMLNSARDWFERRNFQKSKELLERAARLDPANPAVQFDLGRFYGLRYDHAAAEQCLEKAIRLSPDKGKALMDAGERCLGFARQDMAENYFKRAIEQNGFPPETLAQLAHIYEHRHRLDEAADLVGRALQLDGACGLALVVKARLERQAGRPEQAEAVIRTLLNQPDPGARQSPARDARINAWYELGAILDRQKRFDEAMAAFLQAKSMLRLHGAPFLAQLKRVRMACQQVRDRLTPELLHSWHDYAPNLPPARRVALLGGHPRSGTTLLEQVLDSHPDIVSAEETAIFNDDIYTPLINVPPVTQPSVLVTVLQKSRNDYFRYMESFLGQPIGGRLLIDKNPSLTFLAPYLVRVLPEIKFLVALRDPRDICLSVFMQAFPLNATNAAYLSLESTVQEYADLMNMWLKTRDLMKNPWLEIRYEDTVEDLESVSRKMLEFLGVAWDPQVLQFHEHARQKQVRSPTYADVAKPVFKTAVGRWRNYQKYFEPHLARLEPFVKAFGYA